MAASAWPASKPLPLVAMVTVPHWVESVACGPLGAVGPVAPPPEQAASSGRVARATAAAILRVRIMAISFFLFGFSAVSPALFRKATAIGQDRDR